MCLLPSSTSPINASLYHQQVLNAVTAWVRVDSQVRVDVIGSAVCEYFERLFNCYPLNREGFASNSGAAYKTFRRYQERALTTPDHPSVIQAKQIADVAESADYLMLRPKESKFRYINVDGTPLYSEGGSAEDANSANQAQRNAPLFQSDPDLTDFLYRIVASPPFSLYHRILADEGLTPFKWRAFLGGIIDASVRLIKLSPAAIICVFVDELNTAGCLGMVTEAFLSHSLDGVPLPRNIFFVGAINPLRDSSTPSGTMDFTKSNIGEVEDDDTTDYLAMSPYIVQQLSPSMEKIQINYPNLNPKGEESFLLEHLRQHLHPMRPADTTTEIWDWQMDNFVKEASTVILAAQELVRLYNVPRVYMSIRNLIRCSTLLSWMINFTVPTQRGSDGNTYNHQNIFLPPEMERKDDYPGIVERMKKALIMAVSVTYWFQLPSRGHMLAGKAKEDLRSRFIKDITQYGVNKCTVEEWRNVIDSSLKNLFSYANIPRGLAHTTALKENFYAVVLASVNKMALLITGPPGCGKTLSFLLACDALKGSCPAHSVAFQSLKKAKKITYQCSVASSGQEIAAVCSSAHLTQERLDEQQPGRHVCLLGLDEAGLTPENRQALKSLHDFLDMREIGTVMMSNSTLDAAKTSRTIQLLQTQVTVAT
jgi:hypothetical protein